MLKLSVERGRKMRVEKIDLYQYFNLERKSGYAGYLTVTVHTEMTEILPVKPLRPAMLVVPGGGYTFVSQREDEPIVLKFLSDGYNCFTLDYTVNVAGYPVQLTEIAMAVAFIKENAEKYSVNSNKICAVGFSAGAHLIGTLATRYNDEKMLEIINKKAEQVKPNAIILCYGLLSFDKEDLNGTPQKILTDSLSIITNGQKDLVDYLDVTKSVRADCPPAFIWATKQDDLVPATNSIKLALAYHRAGVEYELHIFERGWHGLSTGDGQINYDQQGNGIEFECSNWMSMSKKWLNNKGFTVKYLK